MPNPLLPDRRLCWPTCRATPHNDLLTLNLIGSQRQERVVSCKLLLQTHPNSAMSKPAILSFKILEGAAIWRQRRIADNDEPPGGDFQRINEIYQNHHCPVSTGPASTDRIK